MLLLTTTHQPATDLGYLLHKNPARVHRVELSCGEAIVVFPEASEERCSAAVILNIDPINLIRSRLPFDQYVNDRPYVASSFLASAIARLFGTALTGKSKERPELASQAIDIEVRLPVVSASSDALVESLFNPLGYKVDCQRLPLDESNPDWGPSPYIDLRLRSVKTIKDVLVHLMVLIPVLDNHKHYFVNSDEIDKLLRRGEGWLESHPERKLIATKYLRQDRSLVRQAIARLNPEEDQDQEPERGPSLHDERHRLVAEFVRDLSPASVLDLGCGDGKLMSHLIKLKGVQKLTGLDVSHLSLERAAKRLRLDQLSPKARDRVELLHGSLVYRDARIAGFDLACVVEVIEHLDAERLRSFERTLFEFARPSKVLITTPNREYNVLYPNLSEGQFRHGDHRFEWSRAEFASWANGVATRNGYNVEFRGIGEADNTHGSPSQMGVFSR